MTERQLNMLTVTATNLPRLMACNGSRLMGDGATPVETDNIVKDEGNAAHWLVEQVHAGTFHIEEITDRKAPNGVYITSEMVEHLEEYLAACAGGEIEVDTSFATGTWRINGRADLIKYNAELQYLEVGELKYGWGIVEPEDNWTLIAHVIGWMSRNPGKSVNSATMTIYQPRPYHHDGRVRHWLINDEQIAQLTEQIYSVLTDPDDQLNTGMHCYKCPALATCPAARKAQMNAVDASETAFIDNIDNDELSFQLDHMKRALTVLKQAEKAYSEMALDRLKQGQIINNYSTDTELTNRQWKNGVTPELMKGLTGKDLVKQQLITPAQAEKQGVSKDVTAAMTERRTKGVKLVRMDANAKAKKMFK